MATLKNVTGAKLGSTDTKTEPAKPVTIKPLSQLRRAGVNPLAIELAAKISPKTFADLTEQVDATELKKISGIILAHDISQDFTPQELASMPVVDSVNIDAQGHKVRDGDKYVAVKGNAAPDWTQVQDGKRMKWISFYNTMLGHSKWLKDLEADIEAHVDAENQKQGANKALVAMGKGQRQAALQKLRGRRSVLQNTYRNGVAVVQQKQVLEETFDKEVTFQYYEDAKGNIIPSPSPIILQMVKKPALFDTFSVTSFTHLDFIEAKASRENDSPDATWNAILASLKREDDDEEPAEDPFAIEGREDFFASAAAMLHWMKKPDNLRGVYNQVDKVKDIREVQHLIKTLCNLATEYTDVYHHFEKKFLKVSVMEDVDAGSTTDKATLKEALSS